MDGPKVSLAIMPNYVSADTLAEFEKREGIKVQVSNFSSNEEFLSKLQAGISEYDVAVPADYMVLVLAKLGLMEELDLSQIPSAKQLNPQFLKKPYDPDNRYSVPFDQGTTGIAVNRKLYQGKIESWKDLLTGTDFAGKFSLLDDMREVIGAALKSLGYSLNSKNPEELKQAKELLLKTRHRIKAFTSEPIMPLVNQELVIAHAFMTDALQARKQAGGAIEYVFPSEGGVLWMDNLIIPKGARHRKEAHALINFLLEPKVIANIASNFFVAPANMQTLLLLPDDIRKNPAIFPSQEILKRYEMIQDLEDSLIVWDRVWTEIKVQ